MFDRKVCAQGIHRAQEREEHGMSGTVQIESFNAEFLTREELHDLIFYRKSFDITNVADISETAKRVEYAIEHQQKKLTCRIHRIQKHCGGRLSMVTNSTSGAVSAAAIGVHNLATWNPDYEIGKNYVNEPYP
jgi:hypothetical protein